MFSQCFGMLQLRENEISLPKLSGGTAHIHNLEGTLVKKMYFVGSNASFSLMFFFRHAKTMEGQGSSKKVEGNGNIKNKQIVTNIFVSVQQQY